jgi:hypothetical protein
MSFARVAMFSLGFLLLLVTPTASRAGTTQFEIFDGRSYNGKFYPRIDIIEWQNPGEKRTHMEFQVYWKGHPLDMSFSLEEKDGKKVMLVNYSIPERGEHLCRRVLAPGHFGPVFFVYRDTSDKDMDNTIVSMEKLPDKKGLTLIDKPSQYLACAEAEPDNRMPAGQGTDHVMAPPAVDGTPTPATKGGALKKKGVSVPFGDL